MRQSKPYANQEAVKAAAEELIRENGATTTLEVKNKLRNQGFIAYQAEVSRMLDETAQSQGWEFEVNGKFRVYYFARPSNYPGTSQAGFFFSAN